MAGNLLLLALTAALLSGCQTDGAPSNPLVELNDHIAKKDEPAKPPEPPMTRTRAAELCWMKTENGHASADLDRRADIVTKCIAEKMKAAPPKN